MVALALGGSHDQRLVDSHLRWQGVSNNGKGVKPGPSRWTSKPISSVPVAREMRADAGSLPFREGLKVSPTQWFVKDALLRGGATE